MLLLLSAGSGWTFPNLLPDRLDLRPWTSLLLDRDGLLTALMTSVVFSISVGMAATIGGLLIGRTVRRCRSRVWRVLIYLPFVISPVVAATSLYDVLIRVQLAGTAAAVWLSQLVFATSLASVMFVELWSDRTDRMESLVLSLGGGVVSVWKHVVIPEGRGLIALCFLQSALYSWLDYGLVSILGGGHVVTLTSKLFGYIREASVNQAAVSAFVLLLPVVMISVAFFSRPAFTWLRTRLMTAEQ
jgi:putative spermidine/putrescine transport system permease protein